MGTMPSTRPFNAAQQWFGFLGQEGPPAGEPSSCTWPSSAPMNSIPPGELIMWRATILGGSACIQRCNPIFFRKRLKTNTPQFLYTNAISWSMFKFMLYPIIASLPRYGSPNPRRVPEEVARTSVTSLLAARAKEAPQVKHHV